MFLYYSYKCIRDWRCILSLTAVEEKLKNIPDEYMDEIYNYLELSEYKILYKKQHENTNRFPNRRPGILKDTDFYMFPDFDEPLEDFDELFRVRQIVRIDKEIV